MNLLRTATLAALALAAAGCSGLVHADADEASLVISQPLGQTVPGLPSVVTALPPVTFTFTLPNTPFTGGSTHTTSGGFTLDSSALLNGGAMAMRNSTADFNGLDTFALTATKNGAQTVIASYTRDPSKPPPGQFLPLTAAPNVQLLDLVTTNHQIQITMTATGTMPAQNWDADVQFDLKLHTGATYP